MAYTSNEFTVDEVGFIQIALTKVDRREKTDPVRVRENANFLTLEGIRKCPKECV